MLLIHGARSALRVAQQREKTDQPLTRLQTWAVQKTRTHHTSSVAVALANKMARILWAVWTHERDFNGNYLPPAAPQAA
jgi:transposase